jgi:hypothetical protein
MYLDRVCRACECTTQICTLVLSWCVPMHYVRSTRRASIGVVTRYIIKRGRWNCEGIVGGRISIALWINVLKLSGIVGCESRIRVGKRTSQGLDNVRVRVVHYPNDGKSGPVWDKIKIKRNLIRLKHRTVLVALAQLHRQYGKGLLRDQQPTVDTYRE